MLERLSTRELVPSDDQAREMARIQLDAFAGQALRTAIFPRGAATYDDELAYRAGQIVRSAKDPHRRFLVAVAKSTSSNGKAREKIIGYSLLIMPHPPAEQKESDDERNVKARDAREADRLSWPASMHHGANEKFLADSSRIFEEMHGPNPAEYWSKRTSSPACNRTHQLILPALGALAVEPNYQRKRLGTEMVRWGLDRALQDGKGVVLGATPYARQFYLGMGFEPVGELRIGAETHYGMRIRPPTASGKRLGWGLQVSDATW
jgi:GNAT superfamily N-acetyltransferase